MVWLIFFAFITKAYAGPELEQALRDRRQAAQEAFHAMVQLPASVSRADREAAGKKTLAPAEKRLGEVIQKSLETRVRAEGVPPASRGGGSVLLRPSARGVAGHRGAALCLFAVPLRRGGSTAA